MFRHVEKKENRERNLKALEHVRLWVDFDYRNTETCLYTAVCM